MREWKQINKYYYWQHENGDLDIQAVKGTWARFIILYALTLLLMWLTFTVESEMRFLWGMFGLVIAAAAMVDTIKYFRPHRVYVSREETSIYIQSARDPKTIYASQIRAFRYWHEAVHTTTTGSIIGVGPKAHIQGIQIILENGSDVLILPLKPGYSGLSHNGTEKDEGRELVNLIRDSLRKHIEYVETN